MLNLQKNTDLRTLILRHNSFEDEGARLLRDALQENDTMVNLDLSWNHFQWRGCCAIAEGMSVRRTCVNVELLSDSYLTGRGGYTHVQMWNSCLIVVYTTYLAGA